MKHKLAHFPPEYKEFDVASIQALASGKATEHQQKNALNWIINQACNTYDLSYRPGDNGETCFAEGRRFVGLQIVKLLKLSLSELKKLETKKMEKNDSRK